MKIETKYDIGQVVYFRTDEQQEEYFITGIKIDPGQVSYVLSRNGLEVGAYDFEISKERNKLKSLGIEETN